VTLAQVTRSFYGRYRWGSDPVGELGVHLFDLEREDAESFLLGTVDPAEELEGALLARDLRNNAPPRFGCEEVLEGTVLTRYIKLKRNSLVELGL